MTEKKAAKIARITVTVKGKEVSLPVSEAKELFEGLKEIFEGQEQKTVFVPYYPSYPYPYYPNNIFPYYGTWTSDNICLNANTETFSAPVGSEPSCRYLEFSGSTTNLCASAVN